MAGLFLIISRQQILIAYVEMERFLAYESLYPFYFPNASLNDSFFQVYNNVDPLKGSALDRISPRSLVLWLQVSNDSEIFFSGVR